ncbi:MAG TPA: hypothetical protein VK550_16465 [Polyangiaceae bacterium]|nr:hypothetical protein [Polyangiaceae bacterium]
MLRRTSMPPPRTSVPARATEPIVLDSEPGAFIFGSWKNVFIGVWESQATMTAVDRMLRATTALNDLHPMGRSTIHIVAHGAGLPTPDVRAHFVNVLKKNADKLACVAVVVVGTGFWTSALRSFVTGLRWLAPRSFEFRMDGSIEDVAQWLPAEHLKRTGVELDRRQLVQVIDRWAAPRKPGG